MSSVRHVLPAVIIAPLLALVPGSPASACSCAGEPLEASVARADAVFTGDVLRREEPDARSPGGQATYVVRVGRVYRGEVRAEQEVLTAASSASCGLELPRSGPALFVAVRARADERNPGQLTAGMCGGTLRGDVVPAFLGAGAPPATSPPARPAPATAAPTPPAASPHADVPTGAGNLSDDNLTVSTVPPWLVAGPAAMLTAAWTIAVLRRRRTTHRRRRSSASG